MKEGITLWSVIPVVALYFIICGLIPTSIELCFWRRIQKKISYGFNISTHIIFNGAFLLFLFNNTTFHINFYNGYLCKDFIQGFICSILFYFLLDKVLDPIFDNLFSTSSKNYQDTLVELKNAPITNFIRISLLAPIVEEVLMRGYVFQGLIFNYGVIIALLVSAFLFALLHFNFVQTISAFICELVLGLLYLTSLEYT